MKGSDIEEIILYMGSNGHFTILCPMCGKSEEIDPPAHVTSKRLFHCGKWFRFNFHRRKLRRKKCDESGFAIKDNQRFEIKIMDLSLGGISFETKRILHKNDLLHLVSFFLINGDLGNPIQMKIVRKIISNDKKIIYGAEFQNFMDGFTSKKTIYKWIDKK